MLNVNVFTSDFLCYFLYSYSYVAKEANEVNNTSEKLIHISMRTFSEMGYYGTSLNNIANELGIKRQVYITTLKAKMNCMNNVLKIVCQ